MRLGTACAVVLLTVFSSPQIAPCEQRWGGAVTARASGYWEPMGRRAEIAGQQQAAMAGGERAPKSRQATQTPTSPQRRTATELVSVAGENWHPASEPLPPFRLTDLQGKQWTLADLKGKETFLNFWAVW